MPVVDRVRKLFDLDADPLQIATHLSSDRRLRALLNARPGVRVPGVWDGFEIAVQALVGRQVIDSTRSVARLVQAFGKPVETSVEGLTHLFPRPEVLADADLSSVGIRGTSATRIRSLARAVCKGALTFGVSRTLENTLSHLQSLRGIRSSEAHYIAMRAFGEPDAFPFAILGLHAPVGATRIPGSIAEFRRIAESWRPWRAYAAMQLWAADAASRSRHDRGSVRR
jgi:AraC family transcriptional regulator of adaptative response / DNA-3-methyladenine glycosylase II